MLAPRAQTAIVFLALPCILLCVNQTVAILVKRYGVNRVISVAGICQIANTAVQTIPAVHTSLPAFLVCNTLNP